MFGPDDHRGDEIVLAVALAAWNQIYKSTRIRKNRENYYIFKLLHKTKHCYIKLITILDRDGQYGIKI